MNWQDALKKFEEANFLQSPEWGKVNELIGAKTITEDFDGQGYMLAIVRNAKRGRYLEIPCGPLIDWTDAKTRKAAIKRIAEIAKKNRCVFARLRPQLSGDAKNLAILKELGLKPSPMHLAAEHTVVIDLKKDEETLLSEMRRQTRYEVKQAAKHQITVKLSNSEETFREFHDVQTETARRKGFIPPDLDTLLAEREAFQDNAQIFTAYSAENEPIAYGLFICSGHEVDYYEAASTDLNRRLPGAHAVIWEAIKHYKGLGYWRLNLWGIAPSNQPHHRYAGVTTFKTGFTEEKVEFVPAHDLVISKVKYLKNLIVETARRKKRHL